MDLTLDNFDMFTCKGRGMHIVSVKINKISTKLPEIFHLYLYDVL